ncbi:hypothetical protein UC8_01470 [Roseimaritima ulvae]|uniref:Uncharacterized protein n=1 Tax=Roseimaritima ulvae TaxID=980254 RepID=A0A5B9QH91_9BACT|nr:hypothetical protein UC8_01470 [Roseimaritima ulvae]
MRSRRGNIVGADRRIIPLNLFGCPFNWLSNASQGPSRLSYWSLGKKNYGQKNGWRRKPACWFTRPIGKSKRVSALGVVDRLCSLKIACLCVTMMCRTILPLCLVPLIPVSFANAPSRRATCFTRGWLHTWCCPEMLATDTLPESRRLSGWQRLHGPIEFQAIPSTSKIGQIRRWKTLDSACSLWKILMFSGRLRWLWYLRRGTCIEC